MTVVCFRCSQDLCHQVSLPLYNILSLDERELLVRVEPLVSVGEVTAFLVPRGYTLAVCLEVAEATLGGLAMGVGMTTYSHKVCDTSCSYCVYIFLCIIFLTKYPEKDLQIWCFCSS